jgi:hypothetical protein
MGMNEMLITKDIPVHSLYGLAVDIARHGLSFSLDRPI